MIIFAKYSVFLISTKHFAYFAYICYYKDMRKKNANI